jgi:DNA modification methylase
MNRRRNYEIDFRKKIIGFNNKVNIEQMSFFDNVDEENKKKLNHTDTIIEIIKIGDFIAERFINEFWTSEQRKSNSIHEISYRACFKSQLPNFFITELTKESDYVYDPFLGRGTTVIEAALLNRQVTGNDINPLSKILCESRLLIPDLTELKKYLEKIPIDYSLKADIDLSMFYHPQTESEIVSIKNYVLNKQKNDYDKWIMAVATNRLTGHSKGFFSVYTMPPNQAVTAQRQILINEKRKQKPEYRDVKKLIIDKSISLIKDISSEQKKQLYKIHSTSIFLNNDARETKSIPDNFIQLTVTSPPFLDVIQYSKDNWLRCWFNGIDAEEIGKKMTMAKTIEDWTKVMQGVFQELFRITKKDGFVAFEVGEVKNGKIKLDEFVVPLGLKSGFKLLGILINEQEFTKTANIWGVKNNKKGTNSNRVVLFKKEI